MATQNTKGSKSAAESEYETMFPSGVEVTVLDAEQQEHKLKIYPLPDEIYQRIASALIRSTGTLVSVFTTVGDDKDANVITGKLIGMADSLDGPISALIPDMTAICAAALRVETSWVQANFRLAQRIAVVRAVLIAEDVVGQLLGELKALPKVFAPVVQEAQNT